MSRLRAHCGAGFSLRGTLVPLCRSVLKPAGVTPLGALMLAELFDETELPKGMLSVLPISSERAQKLVEDRRFKKLSFTGSYEMRDI